MSENQLLIANLFQIKKKYLFNWRNQLIVSTFGWTAQNGIFYKVGWKFWNSLLLLSNFSDEWLAIHFWRKFFFNLTF